MSQHIAGAGSRSLVYERGARAGGWRYRAAVILILGIVAFAVHAAAASAQTQIVSTDASQQAFFQGWISQSLVPTPNAAVSVTGTICPSGQTIGCTLMGATPATTPVIAFPDVSYLYQAPYTQDTLDQTRAHLEFLTELGHVYDWSQFSRGVTTLRSGFLRIMRISGSGTSDARWATGQIGNLTISPRDMFGMAYAYCAAYPTLPAETLHSVYWGAGFLPGARQYTQLCSLIKRVAASSPVAVAARRH